MRPPPCAAAAVTSQPVSRNKYRLLFTVLGLAFAFVAVAAVIFLPEGKNVGLPDPVEAFSPADGAIVQRQTTLEIDMQVGYVIELFVDGTRIPDAELLSGFTEPTGQYLWRPGPGQAFEEWTPGFHLITFTWNTVTGLPDTGELRFSFRVL